MVAREWGKEELGVTANRYRVSIRGDLNVLELNSSDGCIALRISLNCTLFFNLLCREACGS